MSEESLVHGEQRDGLEGSDPAEAKAKELFDQIIESRASINRGGRLHYKKPVHRLIPRKFKVLLFLSLVVGVPFFFVWEFPAIVESVDRSLYCGSSGVSPSSSKSIALVDSVGTAWDPSLNASIGKIVRAAGYRFDYYPFGQAGVDFFLRLPENGYSVILLRTHGTSVDGAITTSDPYSQDRWVGQQLSDSLSKVRVNGSYREVFGITPKFVGQMCGDFQGGLVLAMGCYTLRDKDLATAFVKKGADAYLGWNNSISIADTDAAAGILLQQLLAGNSLKDSVQHVMEVIGRDPTLASQLSYFPSTEASYQLPPAK